MLLSLVITENINYFFLNVKIIFHLMLMVIYHQMFVFWGKRGTSSEKFPKHQKWPQIAQDLRKIKHKANHMTITQQLLFNRGFEYFSC